MTTQSDAAIPSTTAVIVIDLQREFVGAEALFPVPDGERTAYPQ